MRRARLLREAEGMATPNSLAELSRELTQAVEIGSRSVVAVHGRPHIPSSGILWRDGAVVTTDHTLKRNEDISVTLPNGQNVKATLAGRDGGTDMAVLRIESSVGGAPKFAADASIKPGALVLALGRRGENGIGVSFGVVSSVGGAWRTWRGGQIDRFIAPDVAIYHGFSGGALVDAEGSVIGLNTSGLSRGYGITVPASTVTRVVEELLARGHVRRGYLGVGLHPVSLPDGRRGLVVLSIEPDGPAARAQVFVGDVLVSINGQPVEDTDDVQTHLGSSSIGQTISVGLVRGGSPLELKVTPADRRPEGA